MSGVTAVWAEQESTVPGCAKSLLALVLLLAAELDWLGEVVSKETAERPVAGCPRRGIGTATWSSSTRSCVRRETRSCHSRR
jgi:hypothetical protein